MALQLTTLTNKDAEFYPTLGPYLASHDVHTAIGGVPWDEDTKTWLIARDGDTLAGFCALNEGSRRSLLESLYVLPGQPKTVTTRLVNAAVKTWGHDRDLHATVRLEIIDAYRKAGFEPVKELTNFITLVRPASVRKTK